MDGNVSNSSLHAQLEISMDSRLDSLVINEYVRTIAEMAMTLQCYTECTHANAMRLASHSLDAL